jgi:hypothetical protein
MKCEKNDLVVDWLNGELSEKEAGAFEAHLKDCAACRQELKEAQAIFSNMQVMKIPEPSPEMESRFSGLLRSYKQQVNKPSSWTSTAEKIREQLSFQPGFRLAYSIVLLVAGVLIGYFLFNKSANDNSQEQLTILSNKVEDMRQTMILSLLGNPSPGERLRAVSYAEESTTIDQRMIDALFTTLNEDPNVNVRLVTLDVLETYGKDAQVRQKLVQSIALQESPLMQSALADVMLRFREKKAVNSLKSLLKNEKLSEPVKKKIEKAIQTLKA